MGYPQLTPYIKGPTPTPDSVPLYLQRELDKLHKIIGGLITAIKSLEAATIPGGATTALLPAGYAQVVKDSTGGSVKLVYNDAGTLKSVTLV